MKSVHLVIPDLFLPKDFAEEVIAGLSLPALQMLLGRGHSETLDPAPLEILLCEIFGIPCQPDAPIAPISAAFDGLVAGCWIRADPVHLNLQRNQLLLNGVQVSSKEAATLCASLNGHFAGQGMEFVAPHPQRWYARLDALPNMRTTPLSEMFGSDVRKSLPTGKDAAQWHQVFNEIQMLLHANPINETREARGEPVINSVWFWGGGCDTLLAKPADCGNSRQAAPTLQEEANVASYGGGCDTLLAKPADCGNSRQAAPTAKEEATATSMGCGYGKSIPLKNICASASSDEVLVEMFAAAAKVSFAKLSGQWSVTVGDGKQLLVWTGLRTALQRGDLAAWRTALQTFECGYAQPLWQALKSGKIDGLQMDVLGRDCMWHAQLTRGDTWAFWRRCKSLAEYSMV